MTAKRIIELFPVLSWAPPWLIAAGVFVAIVIVAFFLQSLIIALVQRRADRWPSLVRGIFLRTRRIARFAVVVLAIDVAFPIIPLSFDAGASVRKVLAAAVIVLIGWVILIATNIAAERYVGGFQLDVEDNLQARKAVTQVRVLKRSLNLLIVILTAAFALMSFDSVRQYGFSLFASAGVAGLVVGLAARPLLSNLIAGVQIALSQPMRLDDVVIVEGEWGRIEEITATYVVVKIWDLRRLVVPLSYFLEKPFENWTRVSADIIGSVFLHLDYTVPVHVLRQKVHELVKDNPKWDGQVVNLQVTDTKETTMEVRVLVSARNSGLAWDLRCEVREGLIGFIQQEYPDALPRYRAEMVSEHPERPPAPPPPPAVGPEEPGGEEASAERRMGDVE